MQNKFQEIFGNAILVIQRYPLVFVMSLFSAVALIVVASNEQQDDQEFLFVKLGLISCLGISLTFAFKMLSQRIGKSILLQIIPIIFLVLYYLLLPRREEDFTELYAFLLIPTFILSHLLVSFIAFFGKEKEKNFWQFNKNLFLNIFLTAVFTGVLIAGVQLAIVAVDQLFDFNFDDGFYRNPLIILSVFGSTFIFLLFNVEGLQKLESDTDYPQILKFFTQYILIPLLLIYVIILYFYSAKILINWELPRGWVSYLVLAYSLVGILALLLVHPLKNELAKSWVKMFSKIFYFTLLPLLILLFTAIFTRILEYGFTEPRYYVLLLAIWLTSVIIYFIIRKNGTIKFIPISLFTFGLFALMFPYLNSTSISKRSQMNELQKLLETNKLLVAGKIDFDKKTSDEVADDISDKFKFLAERKETADLLDLLSTENVVKFQKKFKSNDRYGIKSFTRSQFVNTYSKNPETAGGINNRNTTLRVKSVSVRLDGSDQLYKAFLYQKNEFVIGKRNFEIELPKSEYQSDLFLKVDNQKINLKPEMEKLFATFSSKGDFEVEELTIQKTIGNVQFKILFDTITRTKGKTTAYWINGDSVIILVKEIKD